MTKLSELQLALLMEEIAQAMRSDAPVVDSMRRLRDQRLGRTKRVAGEIADQLQQGKPVADSLGCIDSPMIEQVTAAVAACESTGQPAMLDRVARQLRRRSEYDRGLRLAWLYPTVLLVVGYVVAVLFLSPLVLQNQASDLSWPAWVVATAQWLIANWFWPLALFFVLLGCLLLLLRMRDPFPRPVRLTLFCDALADQISSDVPEETAIAFAASLSGDSTLRSIRSPTIRSLQIAAILSESELPLAAVGGVNQKQAMVAWLRHLALIYGERARVRIYFWSQVVPRLATIVIGGGLILAYAWWVIAPVYQQVAAW